MICCDKYLALGAVTKIAIITSGRVWNRLVSATVEKVSTANGALYFDARGIVGRFYGPRGRQWVLPHVHDAGGFQTMWRDLLACVENGQRPELTLEEVFADFAYMDAAYRSLKSGRPETPVRPR